MDNTETTTLSLRQIGGLLRTFPGFYSNPEREVEVKN